MIEIQEMKWCEWKYIFWRFCTIAMGNACLFQ
jgi:hypothetical protein